MPSLIVFGSHRGTRGAGVKTEVIKVSESPHDVVKKFVAGNGFASFELATKSPQTVWINRRLVRTIRELPAK